MKSFTQTIHIIAVALLIGWGVSVVSAWTAPTTNPPATGTVKSPSGDTAKAVSAAINVTGFDQIKQGGFIIDPKITPAINSKGSFISPLSFFKKTLLPNDDTAVYVGGVGSADPDFTTQFPGSRTIPLTVNLAGRGNNNAIKFIADNAEQCPTGTKISTDSSAFQFWNEGGSKNADLLAKGIRLTGGNPAKGKILISVDNDGRAVWATPKLAANGKDIIFDTTTSPVGSCTTPPPTTTYVWETGNYGVCTINDGDLLAPNSTLGQPVQTRSVLCKNTTTGAVVADSFCTEIKPTTWQSCTPASTGDGTSSTQPVAYTCHTIGGGRWVTAESRGSNIVCTGAYIPQLSPPGQLYFSEGDVVCTVTPPSNSLCREGGIQMSSCTLTDTICPN